MQDGVSRWLTFELGRQLLKKRVTAPVQTHLCTFTSFFRYDFFDKKRAENKQLQCYTACFATPPFCHNNFITFADRLSISGIVIPTGAPI